MKGSAITERTSASLVKSYRGYRTTGGRCTVRVSGDNTLERPLRLRLDLRNHSPSGFEWGYGGSGPAQLALALLADACGDDETALRHYQQFKRVVVAGLSDSWTITDREIRRCIGYHRNES